MATPVVARRALGAELALALLAAGVITCGGDNITRPEGTAAAIAEVGGDGQTGPAGATLPIPSWCESPTVAEIRSAVSR